MPKPPINRPAQTTNDRPDVSTKAIPQPMDSLPHTRRQVASRSVDDRKDSDLFAVIFEPPCNLMSDMATLAVTRNVIRPVRLLVPHQIDTMLGQAPDILELRSGIKSIKAAPITQEPREVVAFNESFD